MQQLYETMTVNEVLSSLKTDEANGLCQTEAESRLSKYGKNKLYEKPKDPWYKIFFAQFKDPMIYVLFSAILVTIAVSVYETIKTVSSGLKFDFFKVGDWPDVIIIMGVVVINAVIGTVQEIKAQSSLEALKKLSSTETTVIRD